MSTIINRPIVSDETERVSHNAGISYIAAGQLLTAARMKNYKQLAIIAEKNLLTSEQNEDLKEAGLTVFDLVLGDYDECFGFIVDNIFREWNERLGKYIFKVVI